MRTGALSCTNDSSWLRVVDDVRPFPPVSADLLTRENLLRALGGEVVIMNEVCDAGQIAEEVIAHLSGVQVMVTLEIEAEAVRIVSENSRARKFGFEVE